MQNFHRSILAIRCLAAALVLPRTVSTAFGRQDYGLDLVTIGAAGNRATRADETPNRPDANIGAVPYDYRIMRTEITVKQWFDFVTAYAPYYPDARFDSAFTGIWISPTSLSEDVPLEFKYDPSVANMPTNMSWRFAARYCNWLTNGKTNTQAAFESGAYDTSTFTKNSDGTINDQPKHSPGAKYWIPTLDEWTKAAYYDPKKDGVGGYWMYPNGTNTPLVSGPPGVGQTDAGTWPGDDYRWFDVGSYPDTKSPWGVLNLSGGMAEWNEDLIHDSRVDRGAARYSLDTSHEDAIDTMYAIPPWIDQWNGLRLATVVPAPPTVLAGLLWTRLLTRRRRP